METVNSTELFSLAVGIVFGLAVLILLALVFKRRMLRCDYDERQKLAQGKAYKCAFYTLLGYLFIGGLFDMLTGVRWCDLYTFIFIGVFCALTVFIVICIRMDAYVSFRENPKRTVWILLAIGAVNLICGVINILTPGALISNGMLTYRVVNLLLGLLLFASALAVWGRYRREVGGRGEDEV